MHKNLQSSCYSAKQLLNEVTMHSHSTEQPQRCQTLQQQQQQQLLMDTAALALILQHPSMRCQRAVCSLLCVSKGMHAAVQYACTGLLPVSLDTTAAAVEGHGDSASSSSAGTSSPGRAVSRASQRVQSSTGWLARHAALVQHLAVHMDGKQPAALRTQHCWHSRCSWQLPPLLAAGGCSRAVRPACLAAACWPGCHRATSHAWSSAARHCRLTC
jgi:hypothetical protein